VTAGAEATAASVSVITEARSEVADGGMNLTLGGGTSFTLPSSTNAAKVKFILQFREQSRKDMKATNLSKRSFVSTLWLPTAPRSHCSSNLFLANLPPFVVVEMRT
jgi:hypothetical protein